MNLKTFCKNLCTISFYRLIFIFFLFIPKIDLIHMWL
nr:MAG TPA_asm: Large T antigen binding domain protein [Caudoviricetes sp.]